MRKNHFWMLAAILFCGLATVFTSCSKDDDDSGKKEEDTPTPTTTKVAERIEGKYYVVASEDMLNLFDVNISYEGPGFGKQTKKLEKTSWYIRDIVENLSTLKNQKAFFSLSVTVTPKAGVKVDANKDYLLGLQRLLAYLIQSSKKETLAGIGTQPDVAAQSYAGSQLTEERLKRMADAFTQFCDEQTLEVYKDYYVVNGEKKNY
jgi:hypothetical protein